MERSNDQVADLLQEYADLIADDSRARPGALWASSCYRRTWRSTRRWSIMARMRLPETEDDHRRVLAVITFLEAR
ncbi:hypothetical protein ACQP1V_19425 [Microtetraspora malaysiensis]|uniref:hypothetical protein n=1 Tax=Microtetraspora malaysiensis TaxID=161358 RepID=UPI003D9102F3